ncbi:DUF167 domain-containing protein [Candidatus Dependentiae bacterium]|nr:DUF167 domain-containing protein [Candidatus Dependentiae bacterium]
MPLIIEIKVKPKSGSSSILLDTSNTIVVRVKSLPEDGKANGEVIKLFSKALRIPQASITIITGATIKNKRIKLEVSLTLPELLTKLGLDKQHSFV